MQFSGLRETCQSNTIVGTIRMKRKRIVWIAAGVLTLLAIVLVSRVTVRQELVGNPTALTARQIETAIKTYHAVHGKFPEPGANLDLLAVNSDGTPREQPFLSAIPRDGWGRTFQWKLVDGKPKVSSAGPDGIHDTSDDIESSGLECRRRCVLELW